MEKVSDGMGEIEEVGKQDVRVMEKQLELGTRRGEEMRSKGMKMKSKGE